MVTVPAGVLSQLHTIAVVNDNIVECDEIFNVTITSVTTCGVTIGVANNAEVMISDDDSKYKKIKFMLTIIILTNRWNSVIKPITIFSCRK